jgi:hypothetical protein
MFIHRQECSFTGRNVHSQAGMFIHRQDLTEEERDWFKFTIAGALIGALATGAVNLAVNEIQGALQRRREKKSEQARAGRESEDA